MILLIQNWKTTSIQAVPPLILHQPQMEMMQQEWDPEWVSYSYVNPSLQVRRSSNGRGLFATRDFLPDEVLVAWTGRVVAEESLASVPEDEHHFVFQIHDNIYLIPIEYGKREPAVGSHSYLKMLLAWLILSLLEKDFVNHSCDPNGGMKGETILVAMRPIKAGEVTYVPPQIFNPVSKLPTFRKSLLIIQPRTAAKLMSLHATAAPWHAEASHPPPPESALYNLH